MSSAVLTTADGKLQPNQILQGYTCQERSLEVKDYPYGFRLRTSIFYWIESKPGSGDRFCSYTINPKTNRANKPKCSTYNTFMYLYTDENGHVKNGCIDAYEQDIFEARFNFILNKIGEFFITDVQKNNLRTNCFQHIKGNAPYQAARYSETMKQVFIKWVQETLLHIKTCEFKELVNFPLRPVEDNPTGEVKMTITQTQL